MADPVQVVRDFCEAWERLDKQAILDAFTEDAVYHNMPMQPAVGKQAISALLDFIFAQAGDGVRFDIKHIVAEGDTVLTERVDTFTTGDGDHAGSDGRVRAARRQDRCMA